MLEWRGGVGRGLWGIVKGVGRDILDCSRKGWREGGGLGFIN